MRTTCQFRRILRLRPKRISSRNGSRHMEISVSFQLTTNMSTSSRISVTQSMKTLTIPFVNRSLSELMSLMTRTMILPALRESKKLKERSWMWLKRASRMSAMALRPAVSMIRAR